MLLLITYLEVKNAIKTICVSPGVHIRDLALILGRSGIEQAKNSMNSSRVALFMSSNSLSDRCNDK